MASKTFLPINEPYICGFYAMRCDGIHIEVVRCHANDWAVFMTLDGHVCAVPLRDKDRPMHFSYTRTQAMRLAKTLLTS